MASIDTFVLLEEVIKRATRCLTSRAEAASMPVDVEPGVAEGDVMGCMVTADEHWCYEDSLKGLMEASSVAKR